MEKDIKKLKLAIEQAQKVCDEMNPCANKFILQDAINDLKETNFITELLEQRNDLLESLKGLLNEIPNDLKNDWLWGECEKAKKSISKTESKT